MKKKTIANIGMGIAIFIIALLGILTVGHIKGWFDKKDDSVVFLTDIRGIILLEREDIAYVVKEDAYLRNGDIITSDAGSTIKIALGESYISLGSNVKVKVQEASASAFQLEVESGKVFVNTDEKLTLVFEERQVVFENTVASLSVRSGVQSISVFAGMVEGAMAGQLVEWTGNEVSIRTCSIQSLNEFNIAQLRKANEQKELVFSNADLDELEVDRWEAIAGITQSDTESENGDENINQEISKSDDEVESSETSSDSGKPVEDKNPADDKNPTDDKKPTDDNNPIEDDNQTDEKGPTDDKNPTDDKKPTDDKNTTEDKTPTDDKKPTDDKEPTDDKKPTDDQNPTDDKKPTDDQTPTDDKKPTDDKNPTQDEEKLSCTITIRCDTILNNWDKLDQAKAPYVPDSGCILPVTTLEFTKGETVFDVLNRVCETYGIQIEYSWTPMYNSYYIEGINNLYEFDCGPESGWMYKVNGWFPNYGCSGYELVGQESIVWCYTCQGLGEDVGADGW